MTHSRGPDATLVPSPRCVTAGFPTFGNLFTAVFFYFVRRMWGCTWAAMLPICENGGMGAGNGAWAGMY
jgi:hypothetical protein